MREVQQTLEWRRKKLEQLINKKKSATRSGPKGKLRIQQRGKAVAFYYSVQGKKYKYLKDRRFATRVAQQCYDEKVLECAEHEMKLITEMLDRYPTKLPEDVYTQLNPMRQQIVTPIDETDEQFVARWQSVSYEEKGFGEHDSERYTRSGLRVRSKSERMIAERLEERGIPFRYEYPVRMKGFGICYPDFYVLNVRKRQEFIYEHFGMMDDRNYAEDQVVKIGVYMKNGYMPGLRFVFTMETKTHPLDMKLVDRLIDTYFL